MSDTTTLTPEERAELIAHVNSGYMTISGEGLKRALAALEQAEARAERAESAQLHLCQWLSDIAVELGCACDNEAMLLAAHEIKACAEKAEAENARLRERLEPQERLHSVMKEARNQMNTARRAVADADSEVKG